MDQPTDRWRESERAGRSLLRRRQLARSDCIMRFRVATGADVMAVATLHAEKAHYRRAYRNEYLDGEVVQERIHVWKERLSTVTCHTQVETVRLLPRGRSLSSWPD